MTKQIYTPYQEKIIKRYYDNRDDLMMQKLSDLATDLYLAEGKKRAQIWKRIVAALQNIGLSQERIDHLVASDNPSLLVKLIQEKGA